MPQPYNHFSDTELLVLLSKSDKQAFTELYKRYWKKLFYVAGKKVIDLGEAESLVHDVLTALWSRRQTIGVHTSLENYLATSMKYRVIKLLDKQKRSANYLFAQQELVERQTPETILDFEELKDKLSRLVNALPDKCRLAYELKEKGFSQKEIALKMDIAEHTVERHLSRAFKSLRAGLSQMFSVLFSHLL